MLSILACLLVSIVSNITRMAGLRKRVVDVKGRSVLGWGRATPQSLLIGIYLYGKQA